MLIVLYDYKAIDCRGRVTGGRLEAANPSDLEMRLRRLDQDLLTVRPARRLVPSRRQRIPRAEIINFCFHLEHLTRAGIPLLDALKDLHDSLEHPDFRKVVGLLAESIEGGQTLSHAMAAHPAAFDEVTANLIRAGEVSGRLPEVLASLAESLRWEDELASHTKKLMLYPAFVTLIVLSATVFLMISLVPQLKGFVGTMGHTLPLHARLLFAISDLIVAHWPLLPLPPIAALGLGFAVHANPSAHTWMDRWKLRLPLFGEIIQKIVLSRFASIFAMLYASGIPVLESLRTTQSIVGNAAVREALEQAEQAIREGRQIAAAFRETGIFPPLVVRMLHIGENTGGLDSALRNVSYFYNRDVRSAVAKAEALVEPLLTLVTGALLSWVMLSVLGPLYDTISRIKA